jgi:hypothetical protein
LWATCLYLDDISSMQERISRPLTVLASPDLSRHATVSVPSPVAG